MVKTRKAQIWGMDLVIAGAIFSLAIVLFYFYSLNTTSESEEIVESLSYEGGIITDNLLSEGHPVNWDSSNAVQVGITTNGKVNETKLERLYNWSRDDYASLKISLNTPYDFYFFFDDNMTINSLPVDGIGAFGVTRDTISGENIVAVNRITIYQEKPIGATLYLWTS